jgi:threonine dehydratase
MLTLDDIKNARKTIGDFVKRTSLLQSQFLSDFCRGRVYLKLENQQTTNSFKTRGAFNRLLNLSVDETKRGVIAASAGNHGLAVAFAAEKLHVPATIVVPKTTPKIKIEKIKEHHAELVLCGDIYDEAEQAAIKLAKKNGLTYVSGYNDKWVIAGQGTIGLEILEDMPAVDIILVPVGGGGLISGISTAVKTLKPNVQIVGVQSEASPVMFESLKAGKIVAAKMSESIAEGLFGGIEKGSITFEIVQKYVDKVILVKEETLKKSIYLLWEKEKQVVEGSGAAAIAPLLENRHLFSGKTVVSVISGGNIDDELFRKILHSYDKSNIRL